MLHHVLTCGCNVMSDSHTSSVDESIFHSVMHILASMTLFSAGPRTPAPSGVLPVSSSSAKRAPGVVAASRARGFNGARLTECVFCEAVISSVGGVVLDERSASRTAGAGLVIIPDESNS